MQPHAGVRFVRTAQQHDMKDEKVGKRLTIMSGRPAAAEVRYTARGSDSMTCPICAALEVSQASTLEPAWPAQPTVQNACHGVR